LERISVTNIDIIETQVGQKSKELLKDPLSFFRFLQDTLIIAFNNSGKLVKIQNTPNNVKLLTFIATTRAFGVSKTAMDQTIRGYPFEGMALTRILLEITESNQYLIRHPSEIDRYLSGKLKMDEIRKIVEKEGSRANLGRYFGMLSDYAHASRYLLTVSLKYYQNRVTIPIIIQDQDRISDVAHGIVYGLLSQYLLFRIVLGQDLFIYDELREREKIIFNPDNLRKSIKISSISESVFNSWYQDYVMDDKRNI